MPLRIWVSNGEAIDAILDPALGAPYANAQDTGKWPDLVASILENPGKLKALPKTQGFLPQHRQAALEGINFWKAFEKEGLFKIWGKINRESKTLHQFKLQFHKWFDNFKTLRLLKFYS